MGNIAIWKKMTFEKGTTYLFRTRSRGPERVKEQKLTFLEYVSAASLGCFALFKSEAASWKESFTPAQLQDYVIEVRGPNCSAGRPPNTTRARLASI
jgi:hypothetical protein